MIAYSKMRVSGTNGSRSRSMNFSELLVFPEELSSGNGSNLKSKAPEATHMKSTLNSNNKDSSHEEESCPEQEHDESNRRVLCRSSSALSSSRLFRFEKQKNMGIESAVKRAFSMRRSSSVSERYCRIHDQSITLDNSEMEWEEDVERTPNDNRSPSPTATSGKKEKHKGGKIIRACRRILRL